MDFGLTMTNPLLQVAAGAGEATIRHACGSPADLRITAEMEQYADGRDAIRLTIEADGQEAEFSMLLRKYFERDALWRVTRRAWNHRVPAESKGRTFNTALAAQVAGSN